jgi:hypothetical protein
LGADDKSIMAALPRPCLKPERSATWPDFLGWSANTFAIAVNASEPASAMSSVIFCDTTPWSTTKLLRANLARSAVLKNSSSIALGGARWIGDLPKNCHLLPSAPKIGPGRCDTRAHYPPPRVSGYPGGTWLAALEDDQYNERQHHRIFIIQGAARRHEELLPSAAIL